MAGFAVFFSIFELTRGSATWVKSTADERIATRKGPDAKSHLPRVLHGSTLVCGGVAAGIAYEFVGRPFDIARRSVRSYRATHVPHSHKSSLRKDALVIAQALKEKVDREGIYAFFRLSGDESSVTALSTPWRQRLYASLRILGRVGPWGVGFLIWESLGPGLSA